MLSSIDLTVIGIYAIILLSVALYVSTRKTAADMSSEDYFLAGKVVTVVGNRRIADSR